MKTIRLDVLKEIWSDDNDDFEKVTVELVDHTRWCLVYEIVFKEISTGKYYEAGFRAPATEQQDWDDGCTEINLTEVEPVEKVVTVYVPVKCSPNT